MGTILLMLLKSEEISREIYFDPDSCRMSLITGSAGELGAALAGD